MGTEHADRLPVALVRRPLRRPDPSHLRRVDRIVRAARDRGAARPRPLDRPARGARAGRRAAAAHPLDEQADADRQPGDIAQVENPRVLHAPTIECWNTRAYHAAEIPGAGGITSATSLARLYACLANGGTLAAGSCCGPRPSSSGARHLGRARGVQRRPDALRGRLHAHMATARSTTRASSGTRATAGRPPARGPSARVVRVPHDGAALG